MENSFTVSVCNGPRDLGHHPHTFARILAERRCCGTKAATRRIFHAEIRQAFFVFADLVNRKDVRVIEARDRLGFASKAHQRLVRIHLVSEYAFHRHDPAGMLLPCAINHSHAPSPDLLQNFVMTEPPLRVSYVRFCENALKSFPRGLPFSFESRKQKAIDAGPVIIRDNGPAAWTFLQTLNYVRNRIVWRANFVHQG